MIYGQIALPTYHFVLNLSQRSVASQCHYKEESILSSAERSGARIEGCGSGEDSRPTRTLRYGFASLNLLRLRPELHPELHPELVEGLVEGMLLT